MSECYFCSYRLRMERILYSELADNFGAASYCIQVVHKL